MKTTQEGPIHHPHGPQIQVGWLGHNDNSFYDYHDEGSVKENNGGGYSPVYIDRGD